MTGKIYNHCVILATAKRLHANAAVGRGDEISGSCDSETAAPSSFLARKIGVGGG